MPPNVDEGIVDDADEYREEPAAFPSTDQGSPDRLPAPSEDGAAIHDQDISEDENLIFRGDATVPITSSTSKFRLKVLMLPIVDYFSLYLLPTFIRHPIPALLFFLVLYAVLLRLAHLEADFDYLSRWNEVLHDICDLRNEFASISEDERVIAEE
jgi:hypothetical protein